MFLYPYPRSPRRPVERVFKFVYLAAHVVLMTSFLSMVATFVVLSPSTFQGSPVRLTAAVAAALGGWGGCNATDRPAGSACLSAAGDVVGVVGSGGVGPCDVGEILNVPPFVVHATLTAEAAPLAMALGATSVLAVVTLMGIVAGLDGVVKVMYAQNVRAIRIRGMYIRLHTMLLAAEISITGILLILIPETAPTRNFFARTMERCVDRMGSLAVDLEADGLSIFGIDLTFAIVALSTNLATLVGGGIVQAFFAHSIAQSKIRQSEHPWERGVLCRTDKPLLRAYNALRKAKMEELKRDPEADPYISYDRYAVLAMIDDLQQQDRATILPAQLDPVALNDVDVGSGMVEDGIDGGAVDEYNPNEDDLSAGREIVDEAQQPEGLEEEGRRRRHHRRHHSEQEGRRHRHRRRHRSDEAVPEPRPAQV